MNNEKDFIMRGHVLMRYLGEGRDVILPDGVEEIGMLAFQNCESLTAITIPSGVTKIGTLAFVNCRNLTSVTISGPLTDLARDAFQGCAGLRDADGFVILQQILFDYVGEEPIVHIPDGVTEIGYGAFQNCNQITSVFLPPSVEKIGWNAFDGCTALTSISIPDSVTEICSNAFHGCAGLQDAEGFVLVRHVLFDFFGKEPVVRVPEEVTEIGREAFSEKSSLKTVLLPKGLKKIGNRAFQDCIHLTSIAVSQQVQEMGDFAFMGCEQLQDEQGFVIVRNILFDYLGKESIVRIPDGVTEIGQSVFTSSTHLTSVFIPSGVTKIGAFAIPDRNHITIFAPPGSCAEGYARKNHIKFEAVREE